MADRLEELRRRHAESTRQLGGAGSGAAPEQPSPSAAVDSPSAPDAGRPPVPSGPRRRFPAWAWVVAGLVLGGGAVLALLLALAFGFKAGTAAERTPTAAGAPAAAGEAPPEDAVSLGTGWICASGLVVTNHHVVAGGGTFTIVFSRERHLPATLVASDTANDLALLRIDGGQAPPGLPVARTPVALGQKVFTIGFPHADLLGIEPKLTDGTISSVNGMQDDPRTLQISVPVQPGNSGGPLLSLRGEVVGVVTSKLNAIEVFRYTGDVPQNVNFAVKSSYVDTLLAAAGLVRQGPIVPAAEGDLEEVARRVRGAVVMVLVQP